jgi:hypothetical protein
VRYNITSKSAQRSKGESAMAQEYGAAQGLIDAMKRPYNAAKKLAGYLPDPDSWSKKSKKPDNSFEKEMTEKANAAKREEAKRKVGGASKAKPTARKKTTSKSGSKKLVTKR